MFGLPFVQVAKVYLEAAERIVAKDPMHLDVLSMAKGVKEIGAFRPIIVIAADTLASGSNIVLALASRYFGGLLLIKHRPLRYLR